MAKLLKPLSCSKFLQVLLLLEASFGPEFDGVFTIYAWKGSGYIPACKGPQAPFRARLDDEPVTTKEIESILKLIGYDIDAFIEMEARCLIPTPEPKIVLDIQPNQEPQKSDPEE